VSKEKIKKNKETWILFSISSTMIKLHFEFGKTAKAEIKRPEHKQNIIRT
jgi:hypothetical protein